MRMLASVVVGMIVAGGVWGSGAGAQAPVVDSTPYVQARDMVSNGEVEQGRRLVDSLLKAAPQGSPAYAEGLYWRAAISQNARNAERDYRRVVVDYPLSPRVPDALLRLGQLEAARGDQAAALQHFQRIVLEYPDSPRRAEASYWVANSYLAHNDLQRGCTANADALARVAPSNVELKNRIDFQQLRCRNVQLAKGAAAAPAAALPPAPSATAAPAKSSATREVPVAESHVAADTPTVAARESTVVAAKATVTKATTLETPRKAAPAPAHTGRGYAVQVAAYRSRVQADALAAKLRARGYASHVDGDAAPYRVRIGHYGTRAGAVAELARLKAKKIAGFVTEP